jgi:hypothetical protein
MADLQPEEEPRMAESSPIPPTSTFVVRFWPEWSLAGPCWRGRIEHVQGQRGVAFQDLEQMLAFMRATVPVIDDQQPRREQE